MCHCLLIFAAANILASEMPTPDPKFKLNLTIDSDKYWTQPLGPQDSSHQWPDSHWTIQRDPFPKSSIKIPKEIMLRDHLRGSNWSIVVPTSKPKLTFRWKR